MATGRWDSHPLEQQLASLHPYGGFSPVRLQGRTIRRGLPSVLVCHHPSYSLLPSVLPALGPGRRACEHLRASGSAALLQGPSLRSGLCCPGPSSLIRPHPPHSQAHLDFTASRFIPDALAVHICICLGDPRLVLSFHRWSFATCRPLRPRGTLRLLLPSTSPKTLAFDSS